jgi:TatD DNase family protein
MKVSPDNSKILYQLGKTPIDLYVYDIEKNRKITIVDPSKDSSTDRKYSYCIFSTWSKSPDTLYYVIMNGSIEEEKSEYSLKKYIVEEAAFENVEDITTNMPEFIDVKEAIKILKTRPVGVAPWQIECVSENTLDRIGQLAKEEKVVAIGEIGLDYYYDTAPREIQKHWFAQQINLARELQLPIIVHDRDAHQDSMNILKDNKANEVGGVFHCYSGSVEMAKELIDYNFYISVGGALTFKNAKKLVEVVRWVPMERLLIETDCPYLTPEPHRGKRNDSSYVRFVAEKVAQIKELSFEEVAEITLENAKKLFRI